MDQGPCPKIHSDSLKKSFEDFGDLYMYDNFVEREFSFRIQDADRIIKVSFKNIFFCYIVYFFLYNRKLDYESKMIKLTKN